MEIDEAIALTRQILAQHGLDWQVKADHARRRAGACHHAKKTITLSRVLLPLYPKEAVRNVILHEIAHALAGARAGHGPKWKKIATQLGASPRAKLPASLPTAPAPWIGRCPAGHESPRYRRPTPVLRCGKCARHFRQDAILSWYFHGEKVPPEQLGKNYLKQMRALRKTNT